MNNGWPEITDTDLEYLRVALMDWPSGNPVPTGIEMRSSWESAQSWIEFDFRRGRVAKGDINSLVQEIRVMESRLGPLVLKLLKPRLVVLENELADWSNRPSADLEASTPVSWDDVLVNAFGDVLEAVVDTDPALTDRFEVLRCASEMVGREYRQVRTSLSNAVSTRPPLAYRDESQSDRSASAALARCENLLTRKGRALHKTIWLRITRAKLNRAVVNFGHGITFYAGFLWDVTETAPPISFNQMASNLIPPELADRQIRDSLVRNAHRLEDLVLCRVSIASSDRHRPLGDLGRQAMQEVQSLIRLAQLEGGVQDGWKIEDRFQAFSEDRRTGSGLLRSTPPRDRLGDQLHILAHANLGADEATILDSVLEPLLASNDDPTTRLLGATASLTRLAELLDVADWQDLLMQNGKPESPAVQLNQIFGNVLRRCYELRDRSATGAGLETELHRVRKLGAKDAGRWALDDGEGLVKVISGLKPHAFGGPLVNDLVYLQDLLANADGFRRWWSAESAEYTSHVRRAVRHRNALVHGGPVETSVANSAWFLETQCAELLSLFRLWLRSNMPSGSQAAARVVKFRELRRDMRLGELMDMPWDYCGHS